MRDQGVAAVPAEHPLALEVVRLHNQTPHEGVGQRTPDEAFKDITWQYKQYDRLVHHNTELKAQIDLAVGDTVRRRIDKHRFDKETAKFSGQVYTIHEVTGYKYRIKDAQGRLQPRKYKYFELLKLREPEGVETAPVAPTPVTGLQLIKRGQQEARKKRAASRAGVDKGNILPPAAKRVK